MIDIIISDQPVCFGPHDSRENEAAAKLDLSRLPGKSKGGRKPDVALQD